MKIRCIKDFANSRGAKFTAGKLYDVVYTQKGRGVSAYDDHGFIHCLSTHGWLDHDLTEHFSEEATD